MSTAIGRSLRTKMGALLCVCLCVHLMMSEDGNYLSSCGLSAVLGILKLLKLTLTEEEIMVQEASFGARLF